MIIGAMKSGTTSLIQYLSQHPEICRSNPKEPQFFSNPQKRESGVKSYKQLWKHAKRETVFIEASTNYTKYPVFNNVPESIDSYNLDTKIIYLVRDPFDRVVSHYNHSVYRDRPASVLDEHIINVSNYYLQLEQYSEVFAPEQIKIIDFETFVNNSQEIVNEVFTFLDLSKFQVNTDRIHNNASERKSDKPLKKSLNAEERQYIHDKLYPDMKLLGKKYDIDVSKWGF